MSQATTWGNFTSGPASPNDYAAREKQSFDALLSMHSGASRPGYAVAGTQWADTSVSGKIAVKVYDGVGDRLIYTIDTATGLKTFAALDLAADPASAMQPSTKQYADTKNALQSISASVASNALTVGFTPQGPVSFRNPTLTNGAPVSATPGTLSLTVPSGATLGAIDGVQSQIALLLIYNGGTIVPAVINLAGGVNLDETGLISTTAINTGSDSSNVAYSASPITNSPYRVAGFVSSTQATAGTWATAPSLVQGAGGQAMAAMQSLGFGQTWQVVTRNLGTTYYNTTSKPIVLAVTMGSGTTGQATYVAVNGLNAGYVGQITGVYYSLSVIIPPGASYLINNTGGGATILGTLELR